MGVALGNYWVATGQLSSPPLKPSKPNLVRPESRPQRRPSRRAARRDGPVASLGDGLGEGLPDQHEDCAAGAARRGRPHPRPSGTPSTPLDSASWHLDDGRRRALVEHQQGHLMRQLRRQLPGTRTLVQESPRARRWSSRSARHSRSGAAHRASRHRGQGVHGAKRSGVAPVPCLPHGLLRRTDARSIPNPCPRRLRGPTSPTRPPMKDLTVIVISADAAEAAHRRRPGSLFPRRPSRRWPLRGTPASPPSPASRATGCTSRGGRAARTRNSRR